MQVEEPGGESRTAPPPGPSLSVDEDGWLATLPNGLAVILRPERSAPVVSAQAWCRSGSIDEGEWLGGGLSHALEHMLFKGTGTRPPGTIDREVQALGGYINAYTSYDRTVYYINAPCEGAAKVVDILSDIVSDASLPEEELEKERGVIFREMDMGEDDPSSVSARRLFELAYQVAPCRYPIIGYPEVFRRIGREDLLAYYRRRYSPGNLFFVVVGDFDPERILEGFLEIWRDVPSAPLPPEFLAPEPRQTGPRRGVEERSFELGHFHLAWHIPEVLHPDLPALDVLSTVLGDGRSSRLHRRVRERLSLAHSIDAWTFCPGSTGLFGISGVADGGRCAPAWEEALGEVERIRSGGISPEELGKALKIFRASAHSSRKTMQGQAQDLGSSWMVARSLGYSRAYLEAAGRLTPDDIQGAARRYLGESALSLAAVLPRGTPSKAPQAPAACARNPVRLHVLENSLRTLVLEDSRLPFVELRAVFRGGALIEEEGRAGITRLMARLLAKGAGERGADELSGAIESAGGSLETYGSRHSFGISIEVMREDLGLGLEILSDIVLRPAMDSGHLERERQAQLASIRAGRDHILRYGFQTARRALFGSSGYGLDIQGSAKSVEGLSLEEVREFSRKLLRPANCVVAAFGNLDGSRLLEEIGSRLGSGAWPGEGGPVGFRHQPAPPAEQRVRRTMDRKQEAVILAFQGAPHGSPQAYALDLLHEACSDLGSRLFARIREDLGLAYSVGSRHAPGVAAGLFAFYALTSPESADRVEEEMRREIEALGEGGLAPEELDRARSKVIGQRKIARQDLGAVATDAALDELQGYGYRNWEGEEERYRRVGCREVAEAAREHFRPERRAIVRVGP